jgi:hypothetical protein
MAGLTHPGTRLHSRIAAAHLCITFRASNAPDCASETTNIDAQVPGVLNRRTASA